MIKFDLTKLVSIKCVDKKIYMVCSDKKSAQNCINEGKIVEDLIAYYKPYVCLTFINETTYTISFDTYEEAIKYYVNFESKYCLPNFTLIE